MAFFKNDDDGFVALARADGLLIEKKCQHDPRFQAIIGAKNGCLVCLCEQEALLRRNLAELLFIAEEKIIALKKNLQAAKERIKELDPLNMR